MFEFSDLQEMFVEQVRPAEGDDFLQEVERNREKSRDVDLD